ARRQPRARSAHGIARALQGEAAGATVRSLGEGLGGARRGLTPRWLIPEEVVDQHVSCREKVVELGVHRGLRVDVAVATPDFGGLRAASSQPAGNLESIIWCDTAALPLGGALPSTLWQEPGGRAPDC